MILPWQFPDAMDEARKRAEEFQRLSPDERLRDLLDTVETGLIVLRESPHREAVERLILEREREWQRAHREVFRRHGR
jgi:hypothetical protein